MKKLSRSLFWTLLLVFGLVLNSAVVSGSPQTTPAVAVAQSASVLPAGMQKITSVEGITEYRLPNGLRVLMFPDPTVSTITVNVTYLVGSRCEGYGETGMAHLLEHMLFKGSPKHPNIPQELSEHGARPNGSTWFDRTNYFETFQATDANLDWALDLEADRMANSFVAKKDLDTEMTVVRNEYEAGENNPQEVLEERVMETAYLWHNYGHPTIGARSDIENVPIERLQAFYHRYYQPDNAVLLVAGRVEEPRTLALIAAKFGVLPKPERVLPVFYTAEPAQDGERNVTLRRVGDVQVVMAAYHLPSGAHSDFAALDLLAGILGDTPSGRLYKALVETKQASQVWGYDYQLHDPGMMLFGAEVRQQDSLEAARDSLLEAVEKMTASPVTQEEVERARQAQLKAFDLILNNTERVGLQLSEWIGMGDWRLFFLHRDRTRDATLADVQRVAAAYLKPSNRTLGLFVPTSQPDRAEIPASPDVAALLQNYTGSAAVSAGEAFDPSPANIESRTMRSALPSGLKLALLPKKTRGGTVVAQLTLRFGDEKSLINLSSAAEAAGDMLLRGSARHTRQQIQDEFDRLKAKVGVSGSATAASASVETQRENLPAVLRLLAEILREPSFPAKEFSEWQQESLAEIEQERSDPQSAGGLEFQRHLRPFPKGDVRYVPTLDEEAAEIKALTVAQIKKFYADFYGATHAEFTLVGDFDPKEMAGLAGALFGDWKSPRPFTRVPNPYNDVTAINQAYQTPDKANAVFLAGMNLPLRDDDPDYPALLMGNYMLGGGFLNSRLAVRIRQKEGLSYGVGSQLQVGAIDKAGVWMMYAILAPQNEQRLERAFREEMERALKEGFTPEELAAAKSGYLQGQQVNRAQDAALAGKLNSYLFYGRTLAWDAELEKKVEALTPSQIMQALRRFIDPTKFSIVKAGDFPKDAAK